MNGSGIVGRLDLISDTKENLLLGLRLAMSFCDRRIVGTKVEDNKLTLYSLDCVVFYDKGVLLPAGLDAEGVLPLLTAWLGDAARWTGPFAPRTPDCDGSMHRGYHLHKPDRTGVICVIQPWWTEYHK